MPVLQESSTKRLHWRVFQQAGMRGLLRIGCCSSSKQAANQLQASSVQAKGKSTGSLDGFMPRLRQSGSLAFATSPIAFNPETAPNVDVLTFVRPHPRDFRIRFQALGHTYYIDGVQTKGSVTEWFMLSHNCLAPRWSSPR